MSQYHHTFSTNKGAISMTLVPTQKPTLSDFNNLQMCYCKIKYNVATIWIATKALLLNRSSRIEIHKNALAKWQSLPGILTALAKCHWDSQRRGFGFWIKMPRPLTSRKVCPKLDHRICHFRPINHRLTSLPHWANALWLKVTSNNNRRTSLPQHSSTRGLMTCMT